jgi:glycolate oxidase iron-sulfur subunit
LTLDLSEVLGAELAGLRALLEKRPGATGKIAFQSPCSLQHGQQIRGAVEPLLEAAGFELTAVADAHLCCGSAGTYSILQPELSGQLRTNKLDALQAGAPSAIVTANIGCLSHLQAGTPMPVEHWIQAIDRRLNVAA